MVGPMETTQAPFPPAPTGPFRSGGGPLLYVFQTNRGPLSAVIGAHGSKSGQRRVTVVPTTNPRGVDNRFAKTVTLHETAPGQWKWMSR